MAKILITGVNGFVGKHLVRELKSRDLQVVGVGQHDAAHPEILDLLDHYYKCDLASADEVRELALEDVDSVISLAGLANVGASFANPEEYKRVNVDVLTVLAEEFLKRKLSPKIIAISTGAVYSPHQSMPITEDAQLVSEGSPYALSKILMEKAAENLRGRGLKIIISRPFNHIGPGQAPGFLVPDLYKKIQEAKTSGGVIKVGNLKTKRDYTDVRDVVKAYADMAIAKNLEDDLYNVCTGKSVAGEEILNLLLKKADVSGGVKVEQDPALIRPNDPEDIYGSNARLQKAVNWQPQIKLEQTIEDFVQYSKKS